MLFQHIITVNLDDESLTYHVSITMDDNKMMRDFRWTFTAEPELEW